jgi:hypothetical protein
MYIYIYIYIYYVLFYFVCLFHIVCASCMCGSTVAPAAFAWADSSASINMASSFSPAASQWRVECDGLQVNAADATGKGRKRKKKRPNLKNRRKKNTSDTRKRCCKHWRKRDKKEMLRQGGGRQKKGAKTLTLAKPLPVGRITVASLASSPDERTLIENSLQALASRPEKSKASASPPKDYAAAQPESLVSSPIPQAIASPRNYRSNYCFEPTPKPLPRRRPVQPSEQPHPRLLGPRPPTTPPPLEVLAARFQEMHLNDQALGHACPSPFYMYMWSSAYIYIYM